MMDITALRIQAFLDQFYPTEDVWIELDGFSYGWWVWENGKHVKYDLHPLIDIFGSIVKVREFRDSMTHVQLTWEHVYRSMPEEMYRILANAYPSFPR